MVRRISEKLGDQTPVTGGVDLPPHLIACLPQDGDIPADDIGRQAYWLIKMHADKVALRFRASDLAGMDDATKRKLIADIQTALGIAQFKKVKL